MDSETAEVFLSFKINPESVPPGCAKLLARSDMVAMGGRIESWSSHPFNQPALAYEIETETKRHMGLVLRNLHLSKERRSLLVEVNETEEALWHNFSPALPLMWELGVTTLVEGPKDARVLHEYGIPSLAYLGPAPSTDHWDVIARYVHTALWIPDMEPLSYHTRKRREISLQAGRDRGVFVWQVQINAKDCGELAGNLDEIVKIRNKVLEASKLRGGGFCENK